MKRSISKFFKAWNGAVIFPFVLIAFLGLNHIMSITTGDEFPLVALVGILLAVAKAFLAEFIGSVLLYINQPDYFKVIHSQDEKDLELKYKSSSWREAALKYYALYCVGAFLVLAFA